MTGAVCPLAPEDIPELGRFLVEVFGAPPGADFAAPEVLRWKYLEPPGPADAGGTGGSDPAGPGAPWSYVARDESGRIIGHIGVCRTAFEGRALAAAGGRVEAIHIIDVASSPRRRGIGARLMHRAHQGVAAQFHMGANPAAEAVGERAGYELRGLVPAFGRVLRAGYWLRADGLRPWQRGLRLAREAADRLVRRPAAPRAVIVPRRVERFGPEVAAIVEAAREHAILTSRDPSRLNAFLRFPRPGVSGWHLVDEAGRLRGLAILNIIPRDGGRTRIGKVVDCLLDGVDVEPWHAAFAALTVELTRQGADLAQAYGSTPWAAEALRRAGYRSRFAVKFHIRDREGLIPRDVEFHLTPLEGDYGYT